MEGSGIRRKVDDLGRIVVPASIRHALGIVEGTELEVVLDGDRVVLSMPSDGCTFCGDDSRTESFAGKLVCTSCMAGIRALDRERSGEVASRFGA